MRIELYRAEHLSQKGSSLQSMIMNKDMPILDLFVRESIQNSLDAKDTSNQAGYVQVDYITGRFDRGILDKELEKISLGKRTEWSNKYLAIKDSNTTGLTGRSDDKNSNLYKLVFGIMEAQQASGAGGSWGIGKTVYFRVGVGLVIYYSRVKKGEEYESLLSAAFVEDETKANALLPAVKGKKYGIAWWGEKKFGSDLVKETRSASTINRILEAFEGLTPYKGTETGTTIIIPFIDEEALLSHNQPKRENGQSVPFWLTSLRDYIKIAVQKWYAPRLNNKKYIHGTYLTVRIDGKPISPNDMEPFFKLTQALYKKASLAIARSEDEEMVRFEDADIKCDVVRINVDIDPKEAGRVAFVKVSKKQLGMMSPDNGPSPYEYLNISTEDEITGKPIVLFCRKPGMVVSYQTDGRWVSGIPLTLGDDYIVGFFVLNSSPKLLNIDKELSLEDYVRKSELADHTSWDDCDLGGIKPSIISKIRKSVANKIAQAFEDEVEELSKTEETGLSTLLGRLLLPPEGFGRRPVSLSTSSSSSSSGSGSGGGGVHKNIRYSYRVKEFTDAGMILLINILTGKKKASSFGLALEMDSVSGPISADKWVSDVGLAIPFFIKSLKVVVNKLDGLNKGKMMEFSKEDIVRVGALSGRVLLDNNKDWYGISFMFDEAEDRSFDIDLLLNVEVRRRDIKPSLSFDY